ncbi:MAG: hypothetical protein KF777_05200 [Planctomycetaceae bacterium]|nr:hypothetical protein [Planctomycetaceae bacterium]
MPVKRLNFTNRSRLTREQANVLVHPGQPATFEAVLNLSHLPESAGTARVFVEAYHRTTRMRFPFGTVAKLMPPTPLELRLTEFPDWKDVSFRVKVTDVSETPGRIIAWANNIHPKGPDDDRQNDLVRWKDADLNGRLWDMEFGDEGPVVLVEKTVGYASIGQDGRFIAVAYPEIFRRSLNQALLIEETSGDDPEHWFTVWAKGYLSQKLGLPPVPEGADTKQERQQRRDWIEQAVVAFGRQFKLADQWLTASGMKGAEG